MAATKTFSLSTVDSTMAVGGTVNEGPLTNSAAASGSPQLYYQFN